MRLDPDIDRIHHNPTQTHAFLQWKSAPYAEKKSENFKNILKSLDLHINMHTEPWMQKIKRSQRNFAFLKEEKSNI
jgi:hypothetical protein